MLMIAGIVKPPNPKAPMTPSTPMNRMNQAAGPVTDARSCGEAAHG
jgi:hypothetical protein